MLSKAAESQLRAVTANLWVAEQPLRYFGLKITTRMTVVKLSNQALVVFSPITLNDALQQQLDHTGPVTHIVAPNLYHYFYLAGCKACYPIATCWAPPGLAAGHPDLPIDLELHPGDRSPWADIEMLFFDGFKTLGAGGFESLNEWVFFHSASRTLILTDTAFHFDESSSLGVRLAARMSGIYNKLSPSKLEQVATKDKEKVRAAVSQVLCWDFDRVVMAHGSIIETGGKVAFREGYEAFLGE
ncbi:MAG: DUF4336 domain-containing protein [Cyanobacteria bacterium J06581_3]